MGDGGEVAEEGAVAMEGGKEGGGEVVEGGAVEMEGGKEGVRGGGGKGRIDRVRQSAPISNSLD